MRLEQTSRSATSASCRSPGVALIALLLACSSTTPQSSGAPDAGPGGAGGASASAGAAGIAGGGGGGGGNTSAGSGGVPPSGGGGNTGGSMSNAGSAGAYDPNKFYWFTATADTLMARYPDGVPDQWAAGKSPWSWETGYLMWGMEKVWRATKDPKYLQYIKQFIDGRVAADGKTTGFTPDALDHFLLGYTLTFLFEETKEAKYKLAADEHRNALKTYPRTTDGGFWHSTGMTGQMWVDGVFMGQMFLARYGKSIGDSALAFDEVGKQMRLIVEHCSRPSGLILHAWDETKNAYFVADEQTGCSSDVWSEGLGWYAILLADVFDFLPDDHASRPELMAIHQDVVSGLKSVVDPETGMWCQVVDKCDLEGNWAESSGTGMFIYLLTKSIGRGYVSAAEYQPVVDRAYASLQTKASLVGSDVKVIDISSIGVQGSTQAYLDSPKSVDMPSGLTSFMVSSLAMELPGTQ